ncbi:MAG: GntR family transcriptional regulator, partial [Microbacterium sp.]
MTSTVGQTGRESALERLRREIYEGIRAPGERVVQTDVAKQYGVSATPVREAMRDLVNEGLLTVEPHRAARVRLDRQEPLVDEVAHRLAHGSGAHAVLLGDVGL